MGKGLRGSAGKKEYERERLKRKVLEREKEDNRGAMREIGGGEKIGV